MESSPTTGGFHGLRKWWICITLFLGTLSEAISVTSVNIAVPTIMASLGASLGRIQWILTGFMITRTVLYPSVGWLGDRLGDRNLFILSVATFTAGSFLCSLAWSAESLIVFRIIQAMGAGPLIGVAMAIMFEAFPPEERGLAMGLHMTGFSLGPFIGPVLGGYLVEHVHWRAIFYMNIPLGLLSIASATLVLPRGKAKGRGAPLDFPGCLTLVGAAVSVLLGLSLGQEYGWRSRTILSFFGASLAFFVLFVVTELRSKQPFVELRYFRGANFSLANLLIFLRGFTFRGANFLITLFIQRGLHYTPLQAGIFHVPAALIMGVVSPIAGTVSDRIGPHVPIIFGFLTLILTLYGFSTLTLWSGMAAIFLFISMRSVGQSSLNAPLNTVALNSLPEGKARMGSGIIGLNRGLGEAFGVAIISMLLERNAYMNLISMAPFQEAGLSGATRYEALYALKTLLLRAGHFGNALEQKAEFLLAQTLMNQALTRAYQDLFLLIAAIYAVMVVLTFLLRSGKGDVPEPEAKASPGGNADV